MVEGTIRAIDHNERSVIVEMQEVVGMMAKAATVGTSVWSPPVARCHCFTVARR